MGFFISRFFWGGLLICWGIVLIVEKLYPIKIPFGRLLIAFLLIYGGIYLITKTTRQKKVDFDTKIFTSASVINSNEGNEYNVVFGQNIIDLSDYDKAEPIKLNTVFGTSTVYLSSEKTYQIIANTAFGETKLPFQRESWLGSGNFIIGEKDREPKIQIEINTVFGGTNVLLKKNESPHRETEVEVETTDREPDITDE